MSKRTSVIIPRENVNDEMVTLVNWCVENGTFVEAGQALADVEGSKAVFTISAPVAGVVQSTLSPGQEVEVGGVLCMIEEHEALPPLSKRCQASLKPGRRRQLPCPEAMRCDQWQRHCRC
jgi:pyruvate/2-oxoglutarate dehydrogenase complex dihydrolipoamide acyltransferase (E2) component